MDSGVMPALPSSAENAIEKQPACAAAMSSSGFVPTPFSKRVLKEYCVSLSTPLSLEMVPLPSFKPPRQTADAFRFMFALCVRSEREFAHGRKTNRASPQSQALHLSVFNKFYLRRLEVFSTGTFSPTGFPPVAGIFGNGQQQHVN